MNSRAEEERVNGGKRDQARQGARKRARAQQLSLKARGRTKGRMHGVCDTRPRP